MATLFAAGADEIAGGTLGSTLFVTLQDILGVFSYVLMPLILLAALYVLKIFSPIAIWEWLNDLDFMDSDEDEEQSNTDVALRVGDDDDEDDEDDEERSMTTRKNTKMMTNTMMSFDERMRRTMNTELLCER